MRLNIQQLKNIHILNTHLKKYTCNSKLELLTEIREWFQVGVTLASKITTLNTTSVTVLGENYTKCIITPPSVFETNAL